MHALDSRPVEFVGWAELFLEGMLYFAQVDCCGVGGGAGGRVVACAGVLGRFVVFQVESLLQLGRVFPLAGVGAVGNHL